MVDDVAARGGRRHGWSVGEIDRTDIGARAGKISRSPRARRPHEHGNVLARLQEMPRQMTARESRGARNEDDDACGTAGTRVRSPAAVRRLHTRRVRETYASRL